MTDVDAIGSLVSAQARVAWGREFLARADRALTESEAIAIVWAVMTYGQAVSGEFVRLLRDPNARHAAAPMPSLEQVPATTTPLDEPQPVLLTTQMAAKLLGCSLKALYHRVAERHIPSSCIVRSGRRLLFHRLKLLAAIERKAGR